MPKCVSVSLFFFGKCFSSVSTVLCVGLQFRSTFVKISENRKYQNEQNSHLSRPQVKHQQVCDHLFDNPVVTCNSPVELCFSSPLIRATVLCLSRQVCGIFHWKKIKTTVMSNLGRFHLSVVKSETN